MNHDTAVHDTAVHISVRNSDRGLFLQILPGVLLPHTLPSAPPEDRILQHRMLSAVAVLDVPSDIFAVFETVRIPAPTLLEAARSSLSLCIGEVESERVRLRVVGRGSA